MPICSKATYTSASSDNYIKTWIDTIKNASNYSNIDISSMSTIEGRVVGFKHSAYAEGIYMSSRRLNFWTYIVATDTLTIQQIIMI